jgi:hypothetical protein
MGRNTFASAIFIPSKSGATEPQLAECRDANASAENGREICKYARRALGRLSHSAANQLIRLVLPVIDQLKKHCEHL